MSRKVLMLFIATVTAFGPCAVSAQDDGIEPYVAFLEAHRQAPVDYVLSLFDRYDIVVAEALHPETTQWEFIYQLSSDARFLDKAGRVFTGFVFHHPLRDRRVESNIPGFYSEPCKKLMRERSALIPGYADRMEALWKAIESTPEAFGPRCPYKQQMLAPIQEWLQRRPAK